MVSKHILRLHLGASGQLRKLIQNLSHVVSSKEVVIKLAMKRAEVVLVSLPKVYVRLRSVVDEDAVSVRRPSECTIGTRVVLDKKRRRLVQGRIWIQRPLYLSFRCEVRGSVAKVIIVEEGHGSANLLISSSVLAIEVLFGYAALIKRGAGLFSEPKELSVCWCHLELSNSFATIFSVYIDEIVISGLSVD